MGTGGMGTGGTGGTAPATGKSARDLVSAGTVTKSASYTMVWTAGQATPNQSKTTSPEYRMQSGLVGAMGTLP
jgi:hypothetical protein